MKEWGRNGIGIGLGPVPVSECLDSDYLGALAIPAHAAESAMHPVGVTRAPLIPVEVTEEEFQAKAAILHRDDPLMVKRCTIIREKQAAKSQNLKRHMATLEERKP